MSLLGSFLVSVFVFLLFSFLSLILGLFWWKLWRLRETTVFLIPVFGLAVLVLFLNFILRLTTGFLAVGLIFSLAFVALFYLIWIGRFSTTTLGLAHKNQNQTILPVFFVMLLTYLILVLPFLLVNGWMIAGYNVNNDSVFHNIMSEHYYDEGYKLNDIQDGKNQALQEKLIIQGYPDSFHHLLGLAYKVTGIKSYRLFNYTEFFFLSTLAATLLIIILTILPFGLKAVLVSVISASSYLQLTYSFQGFAPQIAVTPFLFAGIGLIYLLVANKEKSGRLWPSLSLVFAASLGFFSFSAFFWWGIYVLAWLIWLAYKKESLGEVIKPLVSALILALILNPFAAKNLPKTLAMANNFSSSLGNLLSAKVPLLPVFSSWLIADHRQVPQGHLFSLSLIGVYLGLLGLLVACFKLRHTFLNLTLVSFLISLLILKFRAGPYYFAKSLQPFSVFVVTMTLLGLLALGQLKLSQLRLLFIPALMVYLGLVLFSGSIAFRAASPAPQAAFRELELINKNYGLKNEWLLFIANREDWGRYLLSNFKVVSPQANAHTGLYVSRWSNLLGGDRADFDRFKIDFSRFKYLVIAKAQDQSLVSPLYQQVYTGKYYNVYLRKHSSSVLQLHLPLETKDTTRASTHYLKLQPRQELMLNIKPAKFVAMLARASNGLPKTNNNQFSKSSFLLVTLGGEKHLLQVGSVFKLFNFSNAVVAKTIRFKNIGNQVVELDWLELLKKPYPEQLINKYNQYLKKRSVAVDKR